MKVLKFGGTSVGTVESLRNVKKIVDALEEPGIVVVSALGGLTDGLIGTARMAAAGDMGYKVRMREMGQRHHDIIRTLVKEQARPDVRREVGEFLSQLEDIYTGLALIGDLPEKVLNRIVSFGERMSSIMVANILEDAEHADPLEFIKTKKEYGRDVLSAGHTEELIRKRLALPLRRTVVTGGFISRDIYTGEITNLGRGGSDFTAALIAAALGADVLEIWTDVDGFMTADPRIVPDAKVIAHMTYPESTALCEHGAKVIYPPTIAPVCAGNIPMRVLNTHNPSAPGTLIGHEEETRSGECCGLSCMKDVALLRIAGAECALPSADRVSDALTKHGLSMVPFVRTGYESLDMALPEKECRQALEVLRDELGDACELSIREGCVMLTVVGRPEGVLNGKDSLIVDRLSEEGVEVLSADGAGSANVGWKSVIIPSDAMTESMKSLHSVCFE